MVYDLLFALLSVLFLVPFVYCSSRKPKNKRPRQVELDERYDLQSSRKIRRTSRDIGGDGGCSSPASRDSKTRDRRRAKTARKLQDPSSDERPSSEDQRDAGPTTPRARKGNNRPRPPPPDYEPIHPPLPGPPRPKLGVAKMPVFAPPPPAPPTVVKTIVADVGGGEKNGGIISNPFVTEVTEEFPTVEESNIPDKNEDKKPEKEKRSSEKENKPSDKEKKAIKSERKNKANRGKTITETTKTNFTSTENTKSPAKSTEKTKSPAKSTEKTMDGGKSPVEKTKSKAH